MSNVIQFPQTDPLENELSDLLYAAGELIARAVEVEDQDACTIGQHVVLMVRYYESG